MTSIGFIGLGKMGHNMVLRLVEKKYNVFAYDRDETARNEAEVIGAKAFLSIQNLVQALPAPRVFWIMVPHGVVDDVILQILPNASEGDIIVDGGNSFYKDSTRRHEELAKNGIRFIDAGVSGGPSGARNGACIMAGGDKEDFDALENIFRDLSVEGGYIYAGRHGAGHFVKMVHNGIEYGMMQSLAEGFSILKNSDFELDLKQVAELYNHGSVIESRLVGWISDAFDKFGQDLENVSGQVGHSGEGEWTLEAAKEMGINTPVIEDALRFRVDSEKSPGYTGKLLSAMRNMFGGHQIGK